MIYEILRIHLRPQTEMYESSLTNLINNYLDRKYSSRANSFKLDDAFYMKLWHE